MSFRITRRPDLQRTEAEGRVGVEQLADQVGRVGVEPAGEGEVLGGGQDLLEDLVMLLVLSCWVVWWGYGVWRWVNQWFIWGVSYIGTQTTDDVT